jgi:hypothetical protein
MATTNDREFERPVDLKHTSGPADLARVLGEPSRVVTPLRREGRVSTWRTTR